MRCIYAYMHICGAYICMFAMHHLLSASYIIHQLAFFCRQRLLRKLGMAITRRPLSAVAALAATADCFGKGLFGYRSRIGNVVTGLNARSFLNGSLHPVVCILLGSMFVYRAKRGIWFSLVTTRASTPTTTPTQRRRWEKVFPPAAPVTHGPSPSRLALRTFHPLLSAAMPMTQCQRHRR